MKIPKFFLARGMKYKVTTHLDPIIYQEEEVEGLFCPKEKELKVDLNQNQTDLRSNILHEWFHAIWHECALIEEEIPPWVEHIIICAIARDIVLNKKSVIELLSDN